MRGSGTSCNVSNIQCIICGCDGDRSTCKCSSCIRNNRSSGNVSRTFRRRDCDWNTGSSVHCSICTTETSDSLSTGRLSSRWRWVSTPGVGTCYSWSGNYRITVNPNNLG